MGEYKDVYVEEVNKQIISDVTFIPKADGVSGGVTVTGFLDVEKILYIKGFRYNKATFLEKKFPFSILLLSLETGKDTPGDPC